MLFNLEYERTLSFVVDTTGSMRTLIEGIKQNIIDICTTQNTNPTKRPTEYVLVPFNDPLYGPLLKTRSLDTFIGEVKKLNASGGGDLAEMYFSALILAMQASQPGSDVHVFTDAPPKDVARASEALALINVKQIAVFTYLSGSKGENGGNGSSSNVSSSEYAAFHAFEQAADSNQQINLNENDLTNSTSSGSFSAFIDFLDKQNTEIVHNEFKFNLTSVRIFFNYYKF